MADPRDYAIEINGKVEPAEGGFQIRVWVRCMGLIVEEVGPRVMRTEAQAQEQLEEVMAELMLRVQYTGEGLHA